jgi:glucosamine-6-phosphate deaminase
MEIIIQPDSQQASLVAARIVARTVREKPHAVLGLATGNTPLQLYRELVRMHRESGLEFGGVTSFNLDEYVGVPPAHPSSFHSYMWAHLFSHINMPKERINIPDGLTSEIPAACRKYEQAIRSAGGIDIQVLGIGTNGHIGFNEPSSSLSSRTRIKTLTEETRLDAAAAFGGEEGVPTHVLTMGLGTIMDARMCLLLAFGKKSPGRSRARSRPWCPVRCSRCTRGPSWSSTRRPPPSWRWPTTTSGSRSTSRIGRSIEFDID